MRRLRDKIVPLLLASVLALPACHGEPPAFDRVYGDAASHNEQSGVAPEDPARTLVAFTPPPFTAIYPTSLGQAYGTLERYYEAHASERAGRCLAPYVDGITNTQVVENTSERLVVDVRYLYRDRVKTDPSATCVGYGTRRFVVARNTDGLEIQEMSGPRRN